MTLTEARPRSKEKSRQKVATEARLVTVWGPLGSTGKSTIALNLAYELALLGQRVILLDLDTHAPSLNQLLPISESSAGLAGAARLIRQGRFTLEELERLSLNIKHGRYHFRFLPGLPNASRWSEITPDTIQHLVQIANQNFDIIIADVASSLEDPLSSPESPTNRNAAARTAIRCSTQTIAVLASSQLSVSRYLNAFSTMDELQKTRTLILNRGEPNHNLTSAIRSLTKERIEACIPADEPAVQLAESQQLPLALARRKSPARNAIAALAHKLLAWPPSVN